MVWRLLVFAGMWVDLVSMARWLKKYKNMDSRGGMPFLALAFYTPACWLHGGLVMWGALAAYHYLCNFLIPVKHRNWLSSDRGPSLLR